MSFSYQIHLLRSDIYWVQKPCIGHQRKHKNVRKHPPKQLKLVNNPKASHIESQLNFNRFQVKFEFSYIYCIHFFASHQMFLAHKKINIGKRIQPSRKVFMNIFFVFHVLFIYLFFSVVVVVFLLFLQPNIFVAALCAFL